MANKYLEPVEDHFNLSSARLDDVEDDIFLQGSRNIRSSSNSITAAAKQIEKRQGKNPFEEDDETDVGKNNPFEQDARQQSLAQKRREIEQRSLESTQKSLGMLYETEEIGIATATDLAKQREQLERTSQRLDDINSNLRFSQRHLNGIKSVFGGLKNYFSGNRANSAEASKVTSPTGVPASSKSDDGDAANSCSSSAFPNTASSSTRAFAASDAYNNHPISRIREETSMQKTRAPQDAFQAQIDANLEEMCGNLSRLKGLATDLGTEIESQNSMLDDMNYKIDDVDIKLGKQNKEIKRLLGK